MIHTFRMCMAGLAGLWACIAMPVFAACAPDRVELQGPWGRAAFTVEIADTDEERARGLMWRESMPRQAGMLFLYDRPQSVSFWMRNTLIPLDMVFIDARGVVRHVHRNAIPLDETPIFGGSDILGVLEVNGGITESFGIAAGTLLRHPNLDQTQAAWPCAE